MMKIKQVGTLAELQSLLLRMASVIGRLQPTPKRKRKPRSNAVERFIAAEYFQVPGEIVPFIDFYSEFRHWLPAEDQSKWTPEKVSKALPVYCAFGTWNRNIRCIGNISRTNPASEHQRKPLIVKGGRLAKQ